MDGWLDRSHLPAHRGEGGDCLLAARGLSDVVSRLWGGIGWLAGWGATCTLLALVENAAIREVGRLAGRWPPLRAH